MVWIKWLALGIAALVVVFVALAAFGALRWSSSTRALNERLDAARTPVTPARYDAARELDGLPPPVQRFFRAVLKDGQPIIAARDHRTPRHVQPRGRGADRWKAFTSTQHVVTRRPGFVWDWARGR
ncbi:MAG: hypothetical protein MZW92_41155 [Comamonadaceae bacterium]|nr:hypothetical protein [Comamonadaceae bacterium]